MSPEEVIDLYGPEEPLFVDCRHEYFVKFAHLVPPELEPWYLYWTGNCAVPADRFREVGGFDEEFQSYGAEDVDLGFRLSRLGMPFALSREAWSVDTPHERDVDEGVVTSKSNVLVMLRKYETPVLELSWATCTRDWLWRLGLEHQALAHWVGAAPAADVSAEVADLLSVVPRDATIAVFGCGSPAPDRPGFYFDFDRTVVEAIGEGPGRSGRQAIGIRTNLADSAVDVVVVTTRLHGLWETWGADIMAEAHRIGATVRTHLTVPAAEDDAA
jgi:hypothetical protein